MFLRCIITVYGPTRVQTFHWDPDVDTAATPFLDPSLPRLHLCNAPDQHWMSTTRIAPTFAAVHKTPTHRLSQTKVIKKRSPFLGQVRWWCPAARVPVRLY